MEYIAEGKARIGAVETGKISKKMPVFYNPIMKLNRDISILLLNSISTSNLKIALPLAASGIRGIRFLLELDKSKVKEIHLNDYGSSFKKNIKKNLRLNKLSIGGNVFISSAEANLFLLESKGFDYIDIDPFGTPNPFLDSAIKRLNRHGILAVTATDTSALCGTYPKVCLRKYWSTPLHNELMHEIGIRILIRKAQLVGAQYEKALIPIFSYSKDHYMRIFFRCEKSKSSTNEVLKKQKTFQDSGPVWTGQLWDDNLVEKMLDKNTIEENNKFLKIIQEESKIDIIGFYDIHQIAKKNKLKKLPKKSELIKNIKKLGYKASETHFSPEAIKSDIPINKLLKLF